MRSHLRLVPTLRGSLPPGVTIIEPEEINVLFNCEILDPDMPELHLLSEDLLEGATPHSFILPRLPFSLEDFTAHTNRLNISDAVRGHEIMKGKPEVGWFRVDALRQDADRVHFTKRGAALLESEGRRIPSVHETLLLYLVLQARIHPLTRNLLATLSNTVVETEHYGRKHTAHLKVILHARNILLRLVSPADIDKHAIFFAKVG